MVDMGDFLTRGEKILLLSIVGFLIVMSSWDTVKERGICYKKYDDNIQFCEDFCGSSAIFHDALNSTGIKTRGLFSCELDECTCDYCRAIEFGDFIMHADCVPITFGVTDV